MPLLFVLPVAFISHGTPLVLILGEKIKIHCRQNVLKQIHQEIIVTHKIISLSRLNNIKIVLNVNKLGQLLN
jgi:hypothetical protein